MALRVMLIGLVACSSPTPPTPLAPPKVPDAAPAPPIVDAPPPIDAIEVDAATCSVPPPKDRSTQTEVPNGACKTNAECDITDVAAECNVCNFAKPYATLKGSIIARAARCVPVLAPCPIYCPKPDPSFGAFFRGECRKGTCVLIRWHDGG